jgi:predicted Zn-ribbon and HTH transcriptional regulator
MIPLAQINQISTIQQPVKKQQNEDVKAEFGRLIHAAVINKRFRENLLTNPLNCIDAGYCGESFNFPNDFKNRIRKINARSLEEFSSQVINLFNVPTVSEMAPVYCN